MKVSTPPVPLSERRALRVPEACDYSGLGNSKLYELIREGKIESIKIGSRRLVMRDSLDRFITPPTQSMSNI